MEEMGNELEFEDLARLIGDEIPDDASVNAQAEEKGLPPLSESPYQGTSIRKFHGNGNMMDGNNISMSKFQQSSMDQMQTRQNTMPGDQPLTLQFGKLNFGDEVKGPAWNSLQGQAIMLEDRYSDNLSKQLLNADASVLAAWGSSNHLINGVHDPHMTNLGHQNLLSRHIPEPYKKWQVGQLQPFETSSPAMPLNPELVNVPVQNLQFPGTPQRQQLLNNGRSPVRFMHQQPINHRPISWNYGEEEPCFLIHEKHPYRQHLRNQPLQRLLQNQQHENLARSISSQNHKQQYYEAPIAHHLEQTTHEPSWKTSAFRRASSQLNPVFSPYIDTIQDMEKVTFPRKIIARNPGLNTVDAMRFMSIGADKSANHVNQTRNVRSNSCVQHNNLAPTTECICRGHLGSSTLYSQSSNHKIVSERCNSVDEVRGRIFLLAKDQLGCQFLQQKLMEGSDEDIKNIFNEVIDRIVELMVDAFGNYLVQKLLEVCNDDQRMQIIHRITQENGEIVQISCDMHGTRVIQKVIETLKTQEQVFMIISSLKSGIVTLMKNINGNHVAQYCLDYLMPSCSELLFDAARNSCVDLATDRHGCCVLQKCLGCPESRHQNDLISAIAQNALVISQDQYGNYVVQFILKLKLRWSTEAILKQLEGNFGDMSMQKYSSNVVEKCLQFTNERGQLANIVLELINDPRFDKIMQDPYGNYAIQTALKITEGTLHARLVEAIKAHVLVIRTSPYGKKVLAMVGKSSQPVTNESASSLLRFQVGKRA